MTRAEREREKRKELLKAEERRKKLEDFNKQWRVQSLLKKHTHQQLKEEREKMKEKYLEQINLEADEQIQKFSTQYITRCPTTQHSHDYNHGQELPGWATGQQVSQEPVASGDGQQEGPRRQQAWAENQEGSSENQQEGPENHQGGPDSQQLEAPEEVETSEPTSNNKKKPSIWKRIKMGILSGPSFRQGRRRGRFWVESQTPVPRCENRALTVVMVCAGFPAPHGPAGDGARDGTSSGLPKRSTSSTMGIGAVVLEDGTDRPRSGCPRGPVEAPVVLVEVLEGLDDAVHGSAKMVEHRCVLPDAVLDPYTNFHPILPL
ncbi:uncharacterized protein LOC116361738 [Oncorhynchus kisutch]|uniref:uncharacterized protein LOC116361738 n=1 Tax=Oncorhynchus kisutch TaxID=8019 RepID=UPI0012DEF355|nr:uncharacterized protein LOC116361738 [Oncorhynchus kisutch]